MSILDANGAMACAECGRQARAVRDRFKAENERLRDENARLRSCLSDDADNARQIMGENAKLRELVRDMHKALFNLNLDHCQACPREDACVFVHKSFDSDECAFERDMRELGVEVEK